MNIYYFHNLGLKEKECTNCYTTKDISCFGTETYRSKNNERAKRFRSRCKECECIGAADRALKFREKLKTEGRYKEYRREETRKYREANREKYLQQGREYIRIKRLKEGKEPGPSWLKYRVKHGEGKRLDVKPISQLLNKYLDNTKIPISIFSNTSDVDASNIERILYLEQESVAEETIDKLLIAMHEQDAWNELYPTEE